MNSFSSPTIKFSENLTISSFNSIFPSFTQLTWMDLIPFYDVIFLLPVLLTGITYQQTLLSCSKILFLIFLKISVLNNSILFRSLIIQFIHLRMAIHFNTGSCLKQCFNDFLFCIPHPQ